MNEYVISARKHRPKSFQKVIGQNHITNTLKNAIKNNRISHAYLFSGPRGVGKTSCARIFANMINESESEDNSFNVFELDAASNNTVEDIRNLIQKIRIPPQKGKYKTYIIDEVHMLSSQAFNSFLKTLEEPPKHAIFILATTEKNKIIPTILSRCQIFDFKKISINDIILTLKNLLELKKIKYDEESLMLIAKKSEGSLRDAYTILDQIINLNDKEIEYSQVINSLSVVGFETHHKIAEMLIDKNVPESIKMLNELFDKGFSAEDIIMDLLEYFRNSLMTKNQKTIELINYSKNNIEKIKNLSSKMSEKDILNIIKKLNSFYFRISKSLNKQFICELCFLEISQDDEVEIQKKKTFNKKELVKNRQNNIEESEEKVKKKSEDLNKDNVKAENTEEKKNDAEMHTLDLNSILSQEKNNKKEENSKININVIWTDLLNEIKNKDNETYKILKDFNPRINKNEIIVEIIKEQKNIINKEEEINNLLQRINNSLKLIFSIKKTSEQTRIITLEEKYEKLVKINPNIKKLEEKLKIKFKP